MTPEENTSPSPFEPLKEVFRVMLEDQELFKLTASLYMTQFVHLVGEGFSREEAIKIICTSNVLPSATPKR